MMTDRAGLNFNKIRQLTKDGYPRAQALPSSGFAAGPCLLKDTMQLLSYSRNNFTYTICVMTKIYPKSIYS